MQWEICSVGVLKPFAYSNSYCYSFNFGQKDQLPALYVILKIDKPVTIAINYYVSRFWR